MKKFSWIHSCAVLAVCLLFILPTEAHAVEIVDSGVSYAFKSTLSPDGTLTISGTGAISDYCYATEYPFGSSPAIPIKKVVIEDGVTSIGDGAFYNGSSLISVIYCGTKEQWNIISIDFSNATLTQASLELQYHSYQNGHASSVATTSSTP